MSAPISITYVPGNKVKEFSHPREAIAFFNECMTRGIPESDLSVVNNFGVDFTAYDNSIPVEIQNLIERVELAHGGNIVPRWHWMKKPRKYYTTGRSWYRGKKYTHVSISEGRVPWQATAGVVLHEIAHCLTPTAEHHGRTFYRTAFKLFREYQDDFWFNNTCKAEFGYMKSSRYWYAELFNDENILAEYTPVRQVAYRPSKAQIAAQTAEEMFDNA